MWVKSHFNGCIIFENFLSACSLIYKYVLMFPCEVQIGRGNKLSDKALCTSRTSLRRRTWPQATINQCQCPAVGLSSSGEGMGQALLEPSARPVMVVEAGDRTGQLCWRSCATLHSWAHSPGPSLFPLPRETHSSVEIRQTPGGL